MLGAFIRAHRERLPPPVKVGGRRRTPGWRREELADAAGLGVTWITWLEQGREVNASAPALSRLSQALQLSAAERASLFDLAGKKDPLSPPEPIHDLPPSLLALPGALSVPAYILDPSWTVLAWNAAAADLFAGWLNDATDDKNLLNFVFFSPIAKELIVDWEGRARRLVAEFRSDFNRRPDDSRTQSLVDRLCQDSDLFEKCWRMQDVLYREGGERQFKHSVRGILNFAQTTLLLAQRRDIKLVCLIPQ